MVRNIFKGFVDPMNILTALVLTAVVAAPVYYWQHGAAQGKRPVPIASQDVQVRDETGSGGNTAVVPDGFATFLGRNLPRSFTSRPVLRGDVLDVENEPDAGDYYGIACYDLDKDMTVRNQATGEPIAYYAGLHMYAFALYQMPLPLDAYYQDLSKIEFCETIAYKSSGQSTGYQTAASYFWTLPPEAVQLAQTLSKSADP